MQLNLVYSGELLSLEGVGVFWISLSRWHGVDFLSGCHDFLSTFGFIENFLDFRYKLRSSFRFLNVDVV